MRLDTKALAISCALIWAGAILTVGLVAMNLGVTDGSYYGKDFLLVVASIYPGYRGVPELNDVLVGSLYGLVDAGIGGLILGWLYNAFAKTSS